MTPGDTPSNIPPEDLPEDDDILDLELEDVLDLAPVTDKSSASAIEGVEMLDFLDDDDSPESNDENETDSGNAPLDMTIDMASLEATDLPAATDAEIDNIDELESVEVVDVAAEEDIPVSGDVVETVVDEPAEPAKRKSIVEATDDDADVNDDAIIEVPELVEEVAESSDPEMVEAVEDVDDFLADPIDAVEPSDGKEPSDATVNHTREPTAITEAPVIAASDANEDVITPEVADDAEPIGDIETEFALRDEEPGPSPAAAAVADDASFAAAVSPSTSVSRPRKKSALPMVLIALLLLVIVGGAGAGGLYFAGMLPGLGGDDSAMNTDGEEGSDGSSADSTQPSANDETLTRLQEAEEKLLALYQTSRTGDQIDGAKLDEAQQILADLEANDENIFNQETVQQHKSRFDALAQDYKKQQREEAKAEKSRKFQEAYDFAAANAPKSLDEGALEEARKHANAEQLKLIEALETEVADYQAEQERLAAAKIEESKQAAIDQIVAAVVAGNATQYGEMLNAFVTDFPDATEATDIQEVAKADVAGLDLVIQWNALLTKWAGVDPQDVKSEDVAAMVSGAEELLAAGGSQLPGAAAVSKRIEVLQGAAQREADITAAKQKLMATFTAPPTKSTFVFATKDGHRYYTAEKPTKSGDNYAVNSFVDLEGKTESVELAPADADRSATGAATVSATAAAVDAAVQKIDPTNIEAPLWEAMAAILADEKLDPVIRTQWLLAVAEAGKTSPSMAKALEPISALSDAGVDSSFNWADAEAAAKVRDACGEALAKLPSLDDLKKAAGELTDSDDSFDVASQLQPVGVLTKAGNFAWSLRRVETRNQDGEVKVLVSQGEVFALVPIGTSEAGTLKLHEDVDADLLRVGRVAYIEVPNQEPAPEEPDTPGEVE